MVGDAVGGLSDLAESTAVQSDNGIMPSGAASSALEDSSSSSSSSDSGSSSSNGGISSLGDLGSAPGSESSSFDGDSNKIKPLSSLSSLTEEAAPVATNTKPMTSSSSLSALLGETPAEESKQTPGVGSGSSVGSQDLPKDILLDEGDIQCAAKKKIV